MKLLFGFGTHSVGGIVIPFLISIHSAHDSFAQREFKISGTVEAHQYIYDSQGHLTQPPSEVKGKSLTPFTFYRKDDKWRLDIDHPDDAFQRGAVHRTILPQNGAGFVSVISYPPRPDTPRNQGNAFVNIITNEFFPSDDSYGAHAAWLVFNLKGLTSEYGISNACPHFWKFDPTLDDVRLNCYEIRKVDGGYEFWNMGKFPVSDSNRNLANPPELLKYPPPLDHGFAEAEYQFAPEFLDQEKTIPKSSVLTYWFYLRKAPGSASFDRLKEVEYRFEVHSCQTNHLDEALFAPNWTNRLAVVVDSRASSDANLPVTYITRSNVLDSSVGELQRQKAINDRMLRESKSSKVKTSKPILLLLVITVGIAPIGLWLYSARSKS